MKIGILGGTFDPIHNGHIKIAELALSKLNLDKVLFIPNNIPPHKSNPDISKVDKLNMLKLAVEDNSKFEIDTYEIDKEDISYLYLTLEYLKGKYKDDELYFIAGADNIKEISKWKNPHLIFKYANVVFVKRPNYILDKKLIKNLIENYNGKISVINFEGINISSSDIREKFENCESVKEFIPEKVCNYIYTNCLYPEKIKDKLKEILKEDRYIHSKNVAVCAYNLAKHYKEDEEKAYYAGLIHDCAKNIDIDKQIELINEFNTYKIMDNELAFPKVIHALCGPIVAKSIFDVKDKKILDAIRFHTLGNVNMTLFDKIIYIADLISAERNYKGIEILREMAYNNIDMAIITSIDNTISYLDGKRIQSDVIKLRDYLKNISSKEKM